MDSTALTCCDDFEHGSRCTTIHKRRLRSRFEITTGESAPEEEAGYYMSAGDALQTPTRLTVALDAHDDARALIRLIQCSQCSLPLVAPVATLPCSHSLCRQCLPEPHRRTHITYPALPDRIQGITCPVYGCGIEHPAADCSIDVCLTKVMEMLHAVVNEHVPLARAKPLRLIEQRSVMSWDGGHGKYGEKPREHVSTCGRLLGTYIMASSGQLDYGAEVEYENLLDSDGSEADRSFDAALLERVRDAVHKELDCQICYNLMHDPVTAPCGHTFCRVCLGRVLDHSMHCPACRRSLPIPPSLTGQRSNSRLVALLQSLCPQAVLAREAAIQADEQGGVGDLDTSLFVCTLAFPQMPTFLHIFEPRYRLMIRRAWETNRQFGMLMYNQATQAQGDLGIVNFKEYGTMLHIINVHMLADGRSLIETRGLSRFKVLQHGIRDGYMVGKVERAEDVSLVEEERLETDDIARNVSRTASGLGGHPDLATFVATSEQPVNIDSLTTAQLLAVSLDFVQKMRGHSAPWLHQRILQSYGNPPEDAALFPYWFASVIPIVDEEKYQLLHTTSIRARMKIIVGWIRRIENQRWHTLSSSPS